MYSNCWSILDPNMRRKDSKAGLRKRTHFESSFNYISIRSSSFLLFYPCCFLSPRWLAYEQLLEDEIAAVRRINGPDVRYVFIKCILRTSDGGHWLRETTAHRQ